MDEDFPEIKTGNGVDRDLAATANDRMKKTIIELRNLGGEIKNLKTDIKELGVSNSKDSRKVIILTAILLILTVALVIMTGILIADGRKGISTQNNIALTSQFFNNADTKIITAIENGNPILTENRGQFLDAQLDNYLGNFDTIQDSYDNGLLSQDDLCDSFSYYIGITNQDTEVQNYIAEQQKLYPGSFTSLGYLEKIVSNSSDSSCK
jgi:hypothetical protein